MEQVKQLLQSRKNYLQELIEEKEIALKTAPEGFLRICARYGHPQYYERHDPKDPNGTYIRENDIQVAQALAQKEYDRKIVNAAAAEQKAIQRYLKSCQQKHVEQIYEAMHKDRQRLVEPIRETDEQFVEHWTSFAYIGKGFEENIPEFFTAKGERVRSKSEVLIADLLNRENIPYRYECPMLLPGFGIIYPDFTILNVRLRKEYYWEHMGQMDNPEYAEKAILRIHSYQRNNLYPGEHLILSFETRRSPLNQKQILQNIQHYLK